MADFKPIEVKVEGLDDIRRLSAALEQYNAARDGVEKLQNELNWFKGVNTDLLNQNEAYRGQIDSARQEGSRVACILRGEPVGPRDPGQPISVLESAALEAAEAVHNEKSAVKVIGGLREALKVERVALADRDKKIARLMDTIRRCDITHDQQAETIRAEREKIDQLMADAIQMAHRATLAESASRGHVEEIERLREEVAAAEAEIAQRDPLIKAIREGHVYAAFSEWVIPVEGEGKRAGQFREVRVTYSVDDLKCL
jgi:hypothetical protein